MYQIYEFSVNVSKGSADASDVYGILRSDTASVKVQVSVGTTYDQAGQVAKIRLVKANSVLIIHLTPTKDLVEMAPEALHVHESSINLLYTRACNRHSSS